MNGLLQFGWRRGLVCGSFLLLLLTTGCLTSLNPFYTAQTLVSDDGLIGQWSEKEKPGDGWTFTTQEDHKLKLFIKEGEKSSCLDAWLFKLDDQTYLDVFPQNRTLDDTKIEDTYKMTLIPGHLIFKLTRHQDTIEVNMLQYDWADKLLKEKPGTIAHARVENGDRLILTASTEELQKWMRSIAGNKEAWGEAGVLLRAAK